MKFERQQTAWRVRFGRQALTHLEEELGAIGIARGMLIGSERYARLLTAATKASGGRLAGRWTEVREHVPRAVVDRASEALGAADGVVCVGGGSAIGLGKALAVRTGLPLVAVPTTYSGSEMTPVWAISEQGHKQTSRTPRAQPGVVVYDPSLLAELPPDVAGPSALNAFAHCAEALCAPTADPMSDIIAREGARLIAEGLRADAESLPARAEVLLLGAHFGGVAFAAAGGPLHHRCCHLLGGRYGLPHARTHGALLPYVLDAIAASAGSAMTQLGWALGVDAGAVPGACWDQAARVGCETSLRALGLDAGQATALADEVAASSPLVDRAAAEAMLLAAWRGERPVAGGAAVP